MNFAIEKFIEMEATEWIRLLSVSCLFLVANTAPSSSLEPLGIEEARLQSLSFLLVHRPLSDANLSQTFLQRNIDLALEARVAKPWAQQVPWDLFLNDVLPYASLDEPREDWRAGMRAKVAPLTGNSSTIQEAALLINKNLWSLWKPALHFQALQTPKIMSPSQVVDAGYASCTGLSIFLVNALRSVGIPARVAGTYEWNRPEKGNHNWVEVWDGAAWSFTGPAEWSPKGLNDTWFFPTPAKLQTPGSRQHAIYAASWRPTTDGYFPLSWSPNDTSINGVDVTNFYHIAAARAGLTQLSQKLAVAAVAPAQVQSLRT
eukprot:jgi/Botrbrau1/19687/Bobra.0003s0048.1